MDRSEVEVVALVEAVREHQNFRQLACYSIDALSKQLAPPNSRWREYVDLAIKNSAAEVIIDVLTLHPDEDVLARATACLSRLAVNSTNAKIITERGGVQTILASIDNLRGEQLAELDCERQALELLDKLCDHAHLLSRIAADSTERLLSILTEQCESSSETSARNLKLCASILEKMSRSGAGRSEAMAIAAINALQVLAAVKPGQGADDIAMVMNLLTAISRCAEIDPCCYALKSSNAVETLVQVSMPHSRGARTKGVMSLAYFAVPTRCSITSLMRRRWHASQPSC